MPDGLLDLMEILRQELLEDPPVGRKERAARGNQPETPKPTGIWELRNQMQQSTRADIRELVGRMRGRLFLLSDSQQQTLRDIQAPSLPELISLMGRSMPGDYQIRQRLDTIMNSIPEDRDWTTWWINTALNPGPGIHRPQDHDPQTDPVSDALNGIIRRIGLHALREFPSRTDIAWQIAAGNLRKDSGKQYLQLQNERIPLAGVLTVHQLTRELAEKMLVLPAELPEDNLSPEQVQAELEEEGLDVLRDAGTITTLAALRRDIGVNTLDALTINIMNRQWVHQRVPNGDRIAPWRISQSNLDGKTPETMPENDLGSAELELLRLTAPSHPELNSRDNWTQSRNARIVAHLTGATPEHVIIYMSGHTDEPRGITREPCPMASRCPTHCGIAQTQGAHTFPFNQDGRFDSCRFYRFLKKHGDASPENREAFATLNIQLTLRALLKENQREHVRLAPHRDDTVMNGAEQDNRMPKPSSQPLMI